MQNIKIIAKGASYSLVENALGDRAFLPNNYFTIKEVAELKSYRIGGGSRYTVFQLGDGVHVKDGIVPSETLLFEASEKKFKYQGVRYPVASCIEEVMLKELPLLREFPCNSLFSKRYNFLIPDSSFFRRFDGVKGLIYCLDHYAAHTEEAVEKVSSSYEEEVKRLLDEHNYWLQEQDFKVGDKILGIEITEVERCDNDTANYIFADGGEIHENYIHKYAKMDIPNHVEQVRITWKGVEFYYQEQWHESLDELTDEF